ncbi:MAG TPA: metal ABC transporter permease [Thermomicrobiales bacterium]|jgi:manganese/iron transport system permease protein|nr:manganese ABC transporter permease [Chloroflexota bacterium]HBY45286.1 manganese ABC transporter permease [Chloroflexota bacterium]HQX62127.1 metal ABC transporter permease [Thermomicrobiales bacterium]
MSSLGIYNWLTEPWQFVFMQHAFEAIIIVGLVCGIVGAFVVLRGMAFVGDAFAHAVFPGIVIAFLLGSSIFIGALVAAAVVSLGIGILSQSERLHEDTAIGVMFAGAFALGIALISSTNSYARDLTSFLLGNILGVSRSDLLLTAAIAVVVLGVLAIFRREMVLITFDRTLATSLGVRLWRYDQLFLILLALAIVTALQTVGNILVLAMLITPAATARLVADRLPALLALSAGIGVLSGVSGLYLSYYWNVASGAAVVLVATAIFFIVWSAVQVRQPILRWRHSAGASAVTEEQASLSQP